MADLAGFIPGKHCCLEEIFEARLDYTFNDDEDASTCDASHACSNSSVNFFQQPEVIWHNNELKNPEGYLSSFSQLTSLMTADWFANSDKS